MLGLYFMGYWARSSWANIFILDIFMEIVEGREIEKKKKSKIKEFYNLVEVENV